MTDSSGQKKRASSFYPMMAGAMSQAMAHFCAQPMDVLRTRQVQQQMNHKMVQGAFLLTRGIVGTEGLSAMWRGASVAVVRVAVGGGLYFSVQHQLLEYESRMYGNGSRKDSSVKKRTPPLLHTLAIGSLSRSVASVICCPISVIKTRREASAAGVISPSEAVRYRGALHMAYSIGTKEGLSKLFSGLGPSLMRDAPYAGLYLSIYMESKKLTESSSLSGALAGTMATCLTHPPDVIRTHVQLVAAQKNCHIDGMFSIARSIYRDYGLRGIFRGLFVKVTKRAFTGAFGWLVYEEIMILFGKKTHL
eukprot:gb/GEZN01012413.1/.p1 GENE.gb/GEZN01012413.1/~~gb/GEZN01012413.1/.p1  ORF type:complete len:306 (+),score=30.33 gb/GEZN01012413.1/:61-978(+)